jgi:sialic acid synthase SpsE/mannose-6-phosphate isomerase-like protein (cupin superfamily)
MMKGDLFKDLFIFEMANNHMGDVKHGLKIIGDFHKVSRGFPFNFAFKFQYRDLETFIHPDYKGRQDIKYVKRFTETRLTEKEFITLRNALRKFGFIAVCTPFDENSVDMIERHNFDIVKVASCSFTDWPLLERIVKTDKPIIASTAGVSLDDIDKVVTFFEHRNKYFCLMHCVGEYPTGRTHLELNQIDVLRQRYPGVTIGYSTHEDPDNFDAIKIAIGKGAAVFERHVGVKTTKYNVNAYSSTPKQVKGWLMSARDAFGMCSTRESRREFPGKELADLQGLRRGVFAKYPIQAGQKLSLFNTFFAIPTFDGQLLANDMSKYAEFVAKRDFKTNEALILHDLSARNLREKVLQIIKSMRRLLIDSKVTLPDKLNFELSHHYGIENFEKWGAAIISCINREYCKKLIILLPGQSHPLHHHVKKEETFHVLYGDVTIDLSGDVRECKAGDIIVVERGVKHSFSSGSGVIFEEVSTTHYKDDSYYEDEKILENRNRKTEMTFWSDWLYKNIA